MIELRLTDREGLMLFQILAEATKSSYAKYHKDKITNRLTKMVSEAIKESEESFLK